MVDQLLLAGIAVTGTTLAGVFLASVYARRGWTRPSDAALVGFLDSLAPLGYLLLADSLPLHVVAIAGKALLLALTRSSCPRRPSGRATAAVIAIGALAASSLIVELGGSRYSTTNYVQYFAVAVSLLLTATLLRGSSITNYGRAFVVLPVATAAIHSVQALTGRVGHHYGRYLYVSDTHPNLGGEIAAITALLAAIALPTRWFLACLVPLSVSTFLMQSRTALVAIVGIAAVRLLFRGSARRSTGAQAAIAASVIILGVTAILNAGGATEVVARDVLLLNDRYRGVESGFTGRSDPWAESLETFAQHPIVGAGIGDVAGERESGAHNAFLYGLSRHGLLSLLLWIPLGVGFVHLWKHDRVTALMVLASSVLLAFNARFVNLNPYPFALYVLLLTWRPPSTSGPRRLDPIRPEPGTPDGLNPSYVSRSTRTPSSAARSGSESLAWTP